MFNSDEYIFDGCVGGDEFFDFESSGETLVVLH